VERLFLALRIIQLPPATDIGMKRRVKVLFCFFAQSGGQGPVPSIRFLILSVITVALCEQLKGVFLQQNLRYSLVVVPGFDFCFSAPHPTLPFT